MTEAEWLASDDPQAMLRYARGLVRGVTYDNPTIDAGVRVVSDRKLRLFAVACVLIGGTDHAGLRRATEDAEAYAEDGRRRGSDYDMNVEDAAKAAGYAARPGWGSVNSLRAVTQSEKAAILRDIVGNPHRPVALPVCCARCGCEEFEPEVEYAACAACAACAGPMTARRWLTADVVALAQAAYDRVRCDHCTGEKGERLAYTGKAQHEPCPECGRGAFRVDDGTLDLVRLSILADALEDAGCQSWVESPCPRCSPYKDDPCQRCHGRKTVFNIIPYVVNGVACPWCDGAGKSPPGYHPERDPASGRYEGGWTNCKTCNGGGRTECAIGIVRAANPLLAHLRSPGPHYRGCWAVDLILGRE